MNDIEESINNGLVNEVEEVKTPMSVIPRTIVERWFDLKKLSYCKNYVSNPESYAKLKVCVQRFRDQRIVQVGCVAKDEEVATLAYPVAEVQIPVTPVMIHVLAPFPYESTNVVR